MFNVDAEKLSEVFYQDPNIYHALARLLKRDENTPLLSEGLDKPALKTLIDDAYQRGMNGRKYIFWCSDSYTERIQEGLPEGYRVYQLVNEKLRCISGDWLRSSKQVASYFSGVDKTPLFTQNVPYEGLYGVRDWVDDDEDGMSFDVLKKHHMDELAGHGLEVIVLNETT